MTKSAPVHPNPVLPSVNIISPQEKIRHCKQGWGAGAGARSHGASQFWRSWSWSRSLFKYFCGAGARAGATKILLAPAPVMVHRINFIE